MPLKPSVEVHVVDGYLVAEFWDCLRMDLAPVLQLQSLYADHLRKGGNPGLVLDLKGVEFIGSAVLGGVLKLHRTVNKNNSRMTLCNVDPIVRDTFRVSHVENLFLYFDDREAALRYYAEDTTPQPAPTDPSRTTPTETPPRSPTASRSGGPLSSRRKGSGSGQ